MGTALAGPGPERRHLRPFGLGQPSIGGQPVRTEDAHVRLGGIAEYVPFVAELPGEEARREFVGIRPGGSAGDEVKLLEALEQAAHLAVGVVDRLEHLLDTAEGVLAQLGDNGWLPIPSRSSTRSMASCMPRAKS